jgi:16S rRNA (cytidine1402-2'-O)-methyltransferase
VKGKLLLLPNLLWEEGKHCDVMPESVDRAVEGLDVLIAENEKAGRRYLKRFVFPPHKTFRDISIHLLNEHSTKQDVLHLAEQITEGKTWGLISDAGMPCLADPGAHLVLICRQKNIVIETFPGPSAMMLALVLSGFPAQSFSFHGYLPRDAEPLKKALLSLEDRARKEKMTQLWIETPYRNEKMLKAICDALHPSTQLCVACSLTAPDQRVATQTIAAWRKEDLGSWNDKPAVFLLSIAH